MARTWGPIEETINDERAGKVARMSADRRFQARRPLWSDGVMVGQRYNWLAGFSSLLIPPHGRKKKKEKVLSALYIMYKNENNRRGTH